MAIRWYLLPILSVTLENGAVARGPKYLRWRDNPDELNVPWGMMDYGLMPVCIAWCDATDQQHSTLAGFSDTRQVPANLDATISAGAVTTTRNILEALGIPGRWVDTTDTWRGVLRTTAGLFQFAQRVHGRFGTVILPQGFTLDTTWSELPQGAKSILLQTAQELGINTSGATGSTTLRQIFKAFADAWGSRAVNIGGQVL